MNGGLNPGMMLRLVKHCPFCAVEQVLRVDYDTYMEYERGLEEGLSASTHGIQVLFADLSVDDREFIQSGICPSCWEKTFGGDDDDE